MNKFTLFMKNGSSNKNIVDDWWREKTKLFDLLSKEIFTQMPLQFHIELRINGEYLTFDGIEGCSNLRFMKKKSLIANSITCTPTNYSDNELFLFLNEMLKIAFTQICVRLKKDKIYIDDKRLLSFFA